MKLYVVYFFIRVSRFYSMLPGCTLLHSIYHKYTFYICTTYISYYKYTICTTYRTHSPRTLHTILPLQTYDINNLRLLSSFICNNSYLTETNRNIYIFILRCRLIFSQYRAFFICRNFINFDVLASCNTFSSYSVLSDFEINFLQVCALNF